MADSQTLKCVRCGTAQQVNPGINRLFCFHCGTEMSVQRDGTSVVLEEVVDSMGEEPHGTNGTPRRSRRPRFGDFEPGSDGCSLWAGLAFASLAFIEFAWGEEPWWIFPIWICAGVAYVIKHKRDQYRSYQQAVAEWEGERRINRD